MLEKIKNLSKKAKVALVGAAVVALSAVPAFAEGTGTANSAVTTAMTSLANDMTATATTLLPIALGVISLVIVVRFGIRFFEKVTGTRH